MNKEEIKIKCLELAVDYMNHLTKFQNDRYIQDDKVVAIAETFENYITKEEKEILPDVNFLTTNKGERR